MSRQLVQGLIFDNNYCNLGTLGNLGSNLGSGFYCQFVIVITPSAGGAFGVQHTNIGSKIIISPNYSVTGGMQLKIIDVSGNQLSAHITNATNMADGNFHTIQLNGSIPTKTISIILDNANQPISYDSQQTLGALANFDQGFGLGALFFDGSYGNFVKCYIPTFKIGTAVSSLYGNYRFLEGSGITANDSSGNGNNGTLMGSPLPIWVKRTQVI